MKILMIDNAGFQLQTRKSLIESTLNDTVVETGSSVADLYIFFKKDAYDVVVMDNTIENAQIYLDHILQVDPLQKMLIVSDAIHCVFTQCDRCVENHNIRRLYNPTPIKNIIRMIDGFNSYKCDHYDEETKKMKLL